MKRALLYTIAGTLISFLINHFLLESGGLWLELFYSFAFGLAWGMAFYLDNPVISLPKKLGISFGAMIFLVLIGAFIFDLEKALPSVFKFSIVFVGYYLLASFRNNKSLRLKINFLRLNLRLNLDKVFQFQKKLIPLHTFLGENYV